MAPRPTAGALTATAAHVVAAFDAIEHDLLGSADPNVARSFAGIVCPLFVTWKTLDSSDPDPTADPALRGCIGSLSPLPLDSALPSYARRAAFRDPRFEPIAASELGTLQGSVSLLHSYEEASSWRDWEPGTHGVLIDFTCPVEGYPMSATYLPEVATEQGWTQREAIDSLIRKAGCRARDLATVRDGIRLTRYQSSIATLSHTEYRKVRDQVRAQALEG